MFFNKIGNLDKSNKVIKSNRGNKASKNIVSGEEKIRKDKIAISKTALSMLNSTEEIRRSKVEEIKAKIASGEYEIDSKKLAESILREIGQSLFE